MVYGERIVDPALPTVLVYGHYDVQPPDPLDLWTSPAFEPVIRKTELHPEGAILPAEHATTRARCSCTSRPSRPWCRQATSRSTSSSSSRARKKSAATIWRNSSIQNKELLAADVVLISDTGIIANDMPSITTGLRGLCYTEVKVTGPNRDLHSGLYGGAAPNPINILCEHGRSLKDDQQRITVPGFYDKVIELSTEEREAMAEAPFSEEDYKASIGIGDTEGEKDYSAPERMSIRPTLDVNGIWGGYMGEGPRPSSLPRPAPRFPCALCRTRTRTRSRTCSRPTLSHSVRRAARWT